MFILETYLPSPTGTQGTGRDQTVGCCCCETNTGETGEGQTDRSQTTTALLTEVIRDLTELFSRLRGQESPTQTTFRPNDTATPARIPQTRPTNGPERTGFLRRPPIETFIALIQSRTQNSFQPSLATPGIIPQPVTPDAPDAPQLGLPEPIAAPSPDSEFGLGDPLRIQPSPVPGDANFMGPVQPTPDPQSFVPLQGTMGPENPLPIQEAAPQFEGGLGCG